LRGESPSFEEEQDGAWGASHEKKREKSSKGKNIIETFTAAISGYSSFKGKGEKPGTW